MYDLAEVEVPVVVMALLEALLDPLYCFSELLPMALNVRADDLRHKIMSRMAATVSNTPPITADNMVINGRLSAKERADVEKGA